MNLVGIIVFAITAALLGTHIREVKNGFDTYIAVAACLIIMGFIYKSLSKVLDTMSELQAYISIDNNYVEILLKIVGISYLAQFSSDICRECGYSTIANQIQIFGKVAVMLISLPVVMALIQTVEYLLGK